MSIALANRVKILQEQRVEDRKLIDELLERVKKLEPRPVGRPAKSQEKPDALA